MAMNEKGRLLLVFGEAHATPEVFWSLRDAGYDLGIVFRRGVSSLARRLPGIEIHEITDPADCFDDTLKDFRELWDGSDFETVMPLDDPGLFLVHQLGSEIRSVGPCRDAVATALDKRQQFLKASRAGFSVAAWQSWPTPTPESSLSGADCPVIVKPALAGWVSDGQFTRGRTSFHKTAQDALASLEASPPGYEVIIQEIVNGTGEGVFGVATPDSISSMSGHRRLRMTNPSGSGSCACISRKLEPLEREQASNFIRDCGWVGLFMIETIRQKDGKYWFMELNGRPWGSMSLARRQGLEYPAWAVRQDLLGEAPPEIDSVPGVVCRHLGREIIHVLHLLRGNHKAAPNWPSWKWRWPADGNENAH